MNYCNSGLRISNNHSLFLFTYLVSLSVVERFVEINELLPQLRPSIVVDEVIGINDVILQLCPPERTC